MKIQRIAGALGAELLDIDLSAPLTDVQVAEIRQALLDHCVIFFRDQTITPDQQVAFARAFGEIVDYPMIKPLPNHPEIIPVVKEAHETVNFGGLWHTDTAYLAQPPLGSILLAKSVPPFGGDTLFANGYLAYEALSDGLKAALAPLRGVNRSGGASVAKTRGAGAKADEKSAIHPVIRTHPETGRKSLYVNLAHTCRFDGMTEAESAPLLGYLFKHQIRPEFTCRFSWREGSMAFWDNRCALHNPINDYHGHRRVMHRITIAGDTPV